MTENLKNGKNAWDLTTNEWVQYIKKSLKYKTKNDKYLIDELTQEVCIRVLTYKYHEINDELYFKKLLNRTITSVWFDYLRLPKRKQSIIDFIEIDGTSDILSDLNILNNETIKQVETLINPLTENQKTVVLLKYYKGMTFQQIASAINSPINTCLSHMNQAKIKMKKQYDSRN